MTLPRWLVLIVGGLVGVFGAYRLFLAFRSKAEEEGARRRGGLYGMRRSTHALIGIVYLIMAAMLISSAFGIEIFRFGGGGGGSAPKQP